MLKPTYRVNAISHCFQIACKSQHSLLKPTLHRFQIACERQHRLSESTLHGFQTACKRQHCLSETILDTSDLDNNESSPLNEYVTKSNSNKLNQVKHKKEFHLTVFHINRILFSLA